MNAARLVLCLVIISFIGVPVAGAAADYSVSTGSEHDVPDSDVEFEGTTYTISSLSRVGSGDSLGIQSRGPSDLGYDVNLYTPENQIADSKFVAGGDSSFTFGTSFPPGSYMIVLEQDGDIQRVHPVIIKAYEVTHAAPSRVDAGESFDVTVDVTERSTNKDVNYLQVVLGNEDDVIAEKATKSHGEYTATIPTDAVGTGDYSLYATVRGNNDVRNRDELLGFSDKTTVSVESASSATDSSSGTQTETQTTSPPTTPPPTTSTTDDGSSSTGTSPTDGSTTTDDGVITPKESQAETVTTIATGPGFTLVTAAIAGGLFLAVGWVRSRQRD